jgi:hypothetical protein
VATYYTHCMFFESFNNRDWSLLIWTVIFFSFILYIGRENLSSLLSAIFNKHIFPVLVAMIGYIFLCLYAFERTALWNNSMIKDSIVWTCAVAMPMFFKANTAAKGEYHWKEAVVDNLKLAGLVEFIVNTYVFDLWIELLLVPFLTFVSILSAFSAVDQKHKAVHKLFNLVLSIAGMIMLYHAVKFIIIDFKGFASFQNLKSFVFPVVMTVAYLPFIYLVSLYIAYEEFFVRVRIAYRHNKLMAKFARWEVIKKGRLSLSVIIRIAKNLRIYDISSKRELRRSLQAI